ncbi:MAG: hypothetical protein ABIP21_06095 [Acidimicrobiia bacterium]
MSAWTTRVEPLDAIVLLDTLGAHGVDFVLVGGLAAVAHGYTGLTQDADAVPAFDADNLARLCTALAALDARLYANPQRRDLGDNGAPPEAAMFALTPESLKTRTAWQFSTTAGELDVLFAIDGPGGYDTLIRSAETLTVAGRPVLVAGLDDLIESKETSGRDKDLRALGELRRLRRLRPGH